jgi:hypothetical protein
MTRLAKKEIQYLKYQVYSYRYDDPWIPNKRIAQQVNRSISTVNRYANEAEKENVIWNPQPRLKSYPGKKTALLLFKDKHKAYHELQACDEVAYVCIYQGNWDILAVYNKPVDFEAISGYKETLIEGLRGMVFTPKVEYVSWDTSFENMDRFLDIFDKNICESTFACEPVYPAWDEEDWELYYYFRYNLRKSFNKLRKQSCISWRKYQHWKKTLTQYCTILSSFYPEGYNAYNSLTFCIQTMYEQYVADLFSHLPVTPILYRVGDYFLINIFISRDYKYHFKVFEIVSLLVDEGIITTCKDGYAIRSWREPEE